MKTLLLTTIALLLFEPAFSQCLPRTTTLSEGEKDTIKLFLFNTMTYNNNQYLCRSTTNPKRKARYVNGPALDSSFKPIFSTVILDNDGLISTGSAGSILQDKETSVLSFNYSRINSSLSGVFNIGMNATTSGGVFQLYSGNSWQKGVGLTLGYTVISGPNFRGFDPQKCDSLILKRNRFLMTKYESYIKALNFDLTDSLSRKAELEAKLNFTTKTLDSNFLGSDSLLHLYEHLVQSINEFQGLITCDNIYNIDYNGLIKKEFTEFDKINAIYKGYRIGWWNFPLNIGFNSLKLYNDTIRKQDSLLNFEIEDYFRLKINPSYSWSDNQENYLLFISGSFGLYNTNFLENKHIADIPIIRYDTSLKKVVIRNNENQNLGAFEELKQVVIAVNPSFYLAWFPTKQKVLGVEVVANYTHYMSTPNTVEMKDNFNVTMGLLLRVLVKSPVPKATVGISAGLINAEVGTKVWKESFTAQFKVGVPFNAILTN